MTAFELEIGKLMAQFESLQQRIDDLKKGMEKTNTQIVCLHNDFDKMTNGLMEKMERRFVLRSELAPIKSLVSMIAVATISAICLSLTELLFSKLL